MRIADAIHSRCLLGASEGAVILLRSNVNLLINLGYILGDEHPRERAGDFMCYGFRQQMKFLTTTEQRPPLDLTGAEDRLRACAKRWSDVTIKQRAERLVISNHYVCQAVPRMGPYSA